MSIKKIVVIGPESTGKSTLSEALAAALATVWVPEFARGYLEALGRPYEQKDLLTIARGQLAAEDQLMGLANNYMVCDTCLRVIQVWSNHKYGTCDESILKAIKERKYDLYLLTGIDMPWTYDPLREHEAAHWRQHFYSLYQRLVAESGIPWVAINGSHDERMMLALEAIKNL